MDLVLIVKKLIFGNNDQKSRVQHWRVAPEEHYVLLGVPGECYCN